MSRDYIAKALKRLRETTGLTADEVGAKLGKSGKTVNAWENGRGQPDAEILIKLCSIYHVNNLLAEFDEENSIQKDPEHLSTLENELLNCFRGLNDTGQNRLIQYLHDISKISDFQSVVDEAPDKPISIYRAANSQDHTEHEIIKDGKETIEKLSKIPPVTDKEDF